MFYFYFNLHTLKYLFTILFVVLADKNKDLIFVESGLDYMNPKSVGLQLFTIVNNTSDNDYSVEVVPSHCSLKDGPKIVDRHSLQLVGISHNSIQKRSLKKFILVAPVVYPVNKNGFCIAYFGFRPESGGSIKVNAIKIPFNTYLNSKRKIPFNAWAIGPCENEDEDPYNKCKPVNCELCYNGYRSFFNTTSKRCTRLPRCNTNDEAARLAYDPRSNRCKELMLKVSKVDMDVMDSIANSGHVRKPKDILILKNESDPIYITENVNDTMPTTPLKSPIHTTSFFAVCFPHFTTAVLISIIVIQCCLIIIICLLFRRQRKKISCRFYNQDASMTTPLINTSHIDTGTTDHTSSGDSSNGYQNIKCYKTIQNNNNQSVAKKSLSDDIISKCLNRRAWNNPTTLRSVSVQGSKTLDEDRRDTNDLNPSKSLQEVVDQNDKPQNNKNTGIMVYESEIVKTRLKTKASAPDKTISNNLSQNDDAEGDGIMLLEKEIDYYNYCYFTKENSLGNNQYVKDCSINPTNKKSSIAKASPVPTEKSAQAIFSQDSIDKCLSRTFEDDLIYDTQCSCCSDSCEMDYERSRFERSPILNNRLSRSKEPTQISSLFIQAPKAVHTSYPELYMSSENLDLKLIHMSKASLHSSSHIGSELKHSLIGSRSSM